MQGEEKNIGAKKNPDLVQKSQNKKPKPLIDENYRKENESFGPEGF